MSSFVASWLVPVCLILGLSLSARPAHAQFEECVPPFSLPDSVLFTIVNQSGFDFGDVSEQACDAIVRKGVSTCKSQVKTAAKCFRKAYDANYAVALKQCEQLGDPAARSECKAEHKSIRDEGRTEVLSMTRVGTGTCEGAFELALLTACTVGPPM